MGFQPSTVAIPGIIPEKLRILPEKLRILPEKLRILTMPLLAQMGFLEDTDPGMFHKAHHHYNSMYLEVMFPPIKL